MRREKDALGELAIPSEAYYGVQTERARQNFEISGQVIGDYPEYIWYLAAIKKAAALANEKIGLLEPKVSAAIRQASDEVMGGEMSEEFPVDVFQGGGGTSTNMNLNEVIANRANEILTGHKGYDRVHPNNHVNAGQSTNDVIPSALKLTCHGYLERLLESMKTLELALGVKSEEFKNTVKLGRTCLQDAVPITLGQEFSGYESFVQRQITAAQAISPHLLQLSLGGTAVGTGLGIYPGFTENIYKSLSSIIGASAKQDENLFDSFQNGDIYVNLSALLKSLAVGLSKIATDFRLLSSGPRAGLNEIELPAVQPGSSIMPGKINPVIPELVNQICYQVCGNDTAVTMAVEGGELDLNIWEPILVKCLFESFRLLTNGIGAFTEKCVQGIKVNVEVCEEYAASSIALSTVISSIFDYETGSKVARKAFEERKSVKEVVLEMDLLTEERLEKLLDPLLLTDPEKSGKVFKSIRIVR